VNRHSNVEVEVKVEVKMTSYGLKPSKDNENGNNNGVLSELTISCVTRWPLTLKEHLFRVVTVITSVRQILLRKSSESAAEEACERCATANRDRRSRDDAAASAAAAALLSCHVTTNIICSLGQDSVFGLSRSELLKYGFFSYRGGRFRGAITSYE